MNAEQAAAAATELVAGRMFNAVDGVVADLAADVRERISVPVGRSGSRIIRSKPGEPPRKETGAYQKSWTHRTKQSGDEIRGAAGTPSKIGDYLEFGTSRIKPRHHVIKAAAAVADELVSRLRDKL